MDLLLKDGLLAFELLCPADKNKGRLSRIVLCLCNSIRGVKKICRVGVRCPQALQLHPDQCLCSHFTWEHLSASAEERAAVNPEPRVLILQEYSPFLGSWEVRAEISDFLKDKKF